MSRYVVGIDLGTTHCALASVDTRGLDEGAAGTIEPLFIPQVLAPGEVGEKPLLPSFLYIPAEKEFPAGSLELPWKTKGERLVGWLAREHGLKVPGRLVSSAKSWLSHPGVERGGPILPWAAAADVAKVSPIEASSAYLAHLRDTWNASRGKSTDDRLAKQDVLLTVPASFDAAAREMTVAAASGAGLEHVTLLEEPQAAFYAWLASEGDAWRERLNVGDVVLVCDVGGGTTDFTLIGVGEEAGDLVLNRLAVGEHILLGGDNMDLALAYQVAANLPGGLDGLDAVQRLALTYACRNAKEALFSDPRKATAPVAVLGRGSRVIGGTVKTELARAQLGATVVDGFFPRCEPDAEPARGRRVGLAEIGLPYEGEPAITRHLARFLRRQAGSLHSEGAAMRPTAVLFNGGVFHSEELRRRVLEVLSNWAGHEVPELASESLDLAVAKGAAYYGRARRGKGIRIRGGTSRAYYIGLETPAPAVPGVRPPIKALCVVPMGMEEGTQAQVPGPEMGLVVGEPAEFRFFGSTVRREDRPGTVLDRWNPEEVEELDPIVAELPPGKGLRPGEVVPVRLQSDVTEIGTLDLWCEAVGGDGRWKLEYSVREGRAARDDVIHR
jgi:molecular chaperone DnaK (HSP70)